MAPKKKKKVLVTFEGKEAGLLKRYQEQEVIAYEAHAVRKLAVERLRQIFHDESESEAA